MTNQNDPQELGNTTSAVGTHNHEQSTLDDTALPPAQLSWKLGLAILVSIQIGSGIFSSPAEVDTNAPSPFIALCIWVFSGLLSWAGAASFAELGGTLRRSGGMLEYIRYVYGDNLACVMAWIWIVAVKPSANAIQGIVVGESISYGLNWSNEVVLSTTTLKIIALLVLNAIVLLNFRSTTDSAALSGVFTFFKISAVVLIALGGIVTVTAHLAGHRDTSNTDWYTRNWLNLRTIASGTTKVDWRALPWWKRIGHYSTAIYAGTWAYSGWDNASFIATDIKNPTSQLPRAIHSAMAVVMICQLFVNVSYYILLPWKILGSSNAVAVAAARSTLGYSAGIVMASLVSISCVGTINGTIFSTARMTLAAAREGYIPRIFGGLGLPYTCSWKRQTIKKSRVTRNIVVTTSVSVESHTEHSPLLGTVNESGQHHAEGQSAKTKPNTIEKPWQTPIMAMLLQAVFSSVYILMGTFGSLLVFIGMSVWTFFFLTVLGLIILRYREPELPRPYKVPLISHVVFVLTAFTVVAASIFFNPMNAGFFLFVGVVGSGVYYLLRKINHSE